MRKIDEMLIQLQVKTRSAIKEFLSSERGDTNFVSMLLIIGIIVVLAGLFLTLGKDIMASISAKIKAFIAGL